MKRTLIASFIVMAISASAFAQENYPLADKFPAGCMYYAGWTGGQDAGYDTDKLNGLFSLFVDVMAKGNQKEAQEAKTIFEAALLAFKHKAAVALVDFDKAASTPQLPSFCLAAIIDAGSDKDIIGKAIDNLLATAKFKNQPKDVTVAQCQCKQVELEKGILLTVGWRENLLTAAISSADKAESAFKSPGEKTLDKDEKFLAAMKEVAGPKIIGCVYVDIQAAIDGSKTGLNDSQKAMLDKYLPILGMDKATCLASCTGKLEGGVIKTKTKLLTPAPHTGVLAPLTSDPITDADLAAIPDDADFFMVSKISPAKFLDSILQITGQINPDAAQKMEMGLTAMGAGVGLSIKDDFIASLGDNFTICSAKSQGGYFTGTVLSVSIKDKDKCEAAISRINALAMTMCPSPTTQYSQVRRDGPTFIQIKEGQTTINYIKLGGQKPFASPAWAIHDGKLLVAPYPQVLQSVIVTGGKKPIAKDATFEKLRSYCSEKPVVMMYANPINLVKDFYSGILIGGCVFSAELDKSMPGLSQLIQIPPMHELDKWLQPELYTVSADAKGIILESVNNGAPMSVMTAAPLIATITLPALGRSRALAKRAASASRLSNIGKGVYVYLGEYQDMAPTNLGLLVAKGYLSPQGLVSPSGTTPPPTVNKETGEITGETDYVYFVLTSNAKGETIMAYEKPEINNNEGTHILHYNCSVDWVDMDRFKKLMEESKDDHDAGKGKGYNYLQQK